MHFVYILECKNKFLYTGYTKNIIKRFHQHKEGEGARYTKYNPPVKLLYFEIFDNRKEAMRREKEIKKFNKNNKINLCQTMNIQNLHYLAKKH